MYDFMKRNVTVSIDDNILSEFKKTRLNRSLICEDALRRRCHTNKSDAPEESIQLQCSKCKAIVDKGFMCEWLNKFVCEKCEYDDTRGCAVSEEHCHIRIPGFSHENIDKVKLIK